MPRGFVSHVPKSSCCVAYGYAGCTLLEAGASTTPNARQITHYWGISRSGLITHQLPIRELREI
jgi:hypothetical protein